MAALLNREEEPGGGRTGKVMAVRCSDMNRSSLKSYPTTVTFLGLGRRQRQCHQVAASRGHLLCEELFTRAPAPRELVESAQREEQILVRVSRVLFCHRPGIGATAQAQRGVQ